MKTLYKIFKFFLILISASVLLPFSCLDRIDFIEETEEGRLIVYGLLATGQSEHTVKVGRSRSGGLAQGGVGYATVSLLVKDGPRLTYSHIGNGEYQLFNFTPVEGMSYSLEVIFDNKVLRSNYQEIPKTVGSDNLSYEVAYEPFRTSVNEHVFKVYSKSQLPNSPDQLFIRWEVEEAHYWSLLWIPPGTPPPPPCFIFDIMNPTKINLFDGTATANRQLDQLLATRKIDNAFLFPFFVTVKQLSISREAFEYWRKIDLVINNRGSLFDIPPAPVFGNIVNIEDPDEHILGFFEVAKSSMSRFYVTSEISPIYLYPICEYIQGKSVDQYPSECITCAGRAGGRAWTSRRPTWWVYD